MSKKSEARRLEAVDPTLPTTTITLDGKEYRLCFDLGALAEAETAINRKGIPFSFSEDLQKVTQIVPCCCFFAAALRRSHPEITFDEGYALVTPDKFLAICAVTSNLLATALRGPKADPTEASAASHEIAED